MAVVSSPVLDVSALRSRVVTPDQLTRRSHRVLVTGASGFVGSKIAELLGANGIPVIATDVRGSHNFMYRNPMVEFAEADLTNKDSVAKLFSDYNITFILHPAAIFKFSASPDLLHLVNVVGTENLLDIASNSLGVSACVVFSSAMVYGENNTGKPIDESFLPHPPNPYAQSKFDEEVVALKFKDAFKMIIIRPTAVYGRGSAYGLRKIIDIFANDFPLLPLPFMGKIRNSVVHVRDVAGSAIHLLSNFEELGDKTIFNISDSTPVFIKDAFELIKEKLGSKTILMPLPLPFSQAFERIMGFVSPETEIPLYHPFTFKLITTLEPDDFASLMGENTFNSGRLLSTGYTLTYPSIQTGIPATIEHCVDFGELPPAAIARIKSGAKRK